MTTLPEKTRVHRRIPKEAFYQRLAFSPSVKNAFAKQIAHIFVENSLTKESLDLSVDSDLDEILVDAWNFLALTEEEEERQYELNNGYQGN